MKVSTVLQSFTIQGSPFQTLTTLSKKTVYILSLPMIISNAWIKSHLNLFCVKGNIFKYRSRSSYDLFFKLGINLVNLRWTRSSFATSFWKERYSKAWKKHSIRTNQGIVESNDCIFGLVLECSTNKVKHFVCFLNTPEHNSLGFRLLVTVTPKSIF